MIVLLTGGIGCGKSSVAALLRGLGATTVDADTIVHELHEDPDVQAEVAALLGLPGPVSRADVARHVFGDDSLLRELEAILHPRVHARMAALRASNPADHVLVFEFPLPPTPQPGDVVICVEADEGVRVGRLRERGMQDADIFARIAAAPGPMAYREHAHHVIVNDGDLTDLRDRVTALWEDLRHDTRDL